MFKKDVFFIKNMWLIIFIYNFAYYLGAVECFGSYCIYSVKNKQNSINNN